MPSTDPSSAISMQFLAELLRHFQPRDFSVRLWDGSELLPETAAPPRFTLTFTRPSSLVECFLPGKIITLCQAFLQGAFDVQGDWDAFWQFVQDLYQGDLPPGVLSRKRVEPALAGLPRRELPTSGRSAIRLEGEVHGEDRDRQAIASHYDVSNDFYALWLDQRMVYSCAYFKDPTTDLDTAQRDKLDYVCRKLRLQPGERMLDIGCGWGGLAIHAAQNYGVEVLGVTLSQAQYDVATRRVAQAGLSDRCRIELRDYRQINQPGSFDKISSIGMAEHIGESKLVEYFENAWNLLRPGGVFLNHAIGRHPKNPVPAGSTFIALYIFPDGELQPIDVVLRAAENVGFETRDVESLREHYALTCRYWLARLEANASRAVELSEEVTYRTWQLYLAFCAFGFATGQPNIYQSLLSKPDPNANGQPTTRADWYV